MDGVSSASGIFAVVSIAIQLAETVKKIVEFGKAVKDAPIHIRALFSGLEVLAAVISQIQQLDGYFACDKVSEKALLNSAFKFAFGEAEIQSIRTSIEEAKSTLQLVQSTSLSVVDRIRSGLGFNNAKMQIDYYGTTEPEKYELTRETLLAVGSANVARGKLPSTSACNGNLVRTNLTPFFPASRPFDLRLSNCQSSRKFHLSTPILTVYAQTRTSIVKTTRSSEVTETTEGEFTFVLYPKSAGRLFGITRGLLVSANATSGWQYSLQPFYAVEETALVFEFCSAGNLEGLKSLFKRKEASPWDRDPKGQTPLMVASQALQLDVAEFLLQQGADPHAICWDNTTEPITAVTINKTVDIIPKLAMLSLLQKHRREDYEDLTIGYMICRVLLFYRPQTDIEIPWRQRRAAIMKLFLMLLPFFADDNPYRADIIFFAVVWCYEQEVLQYALRTTKGYIDRNPGNGSILHEALHHRLLDRDPASMRLIVSKSNDLYRLRARNYLDPQLETPTALAMYDMRTFLAWRNMLHDLGHETMAFVERELSEGSLRENGWTNSSLCEIFDTNALPDPYYGPAILGFLGCERCGDSGTTCFGKLKVDLVWRRYLRDIRMKHLARARKNNPEYSTTPGSNPNNAGIQQTQGTSSSSSSDRVCVGGRELPYRIVCSTKCTDGVCVAWIYEDDTDSEPDLPLCPSESLSIVGDEEVVVIEEEPCPTSSMPGAFKDS
ncbi:hypothetical protein L207DRAFT_587407 [Hyaloscypha variabilis F]|uniref:Uncharacterized protein n=1 Tax=Hyaloscypha variabilis (strain UAMH 11265 / GT02V1 / F) TaxID=1149755 RepID=A0A2J6RD18_HYAVF|nr:hypothetical protein L207DRAFT_587407 [Hyaloscypha variabilis F]